MPVIDLDLHQVTLKDVVSEIAKQGGGILIPKQDGLLLFNPLDEKEGGDPFDPTHVDGGVLFEQVLYEDWDKPQPAE